MRALRSRGGGLLTLLVAAAAVVVAGTFLIFQLADRPSVVALSPQPGAAIADPATPVVFAVEGAERLSDLRVTLDGRDVTARARVAGDRITVPIANLSDGEHHATVSFGTDNLFARTVATDWDFTVDTVAPPLRITGPAPDALTARSRVRFRGTAEPGAEVTVAAGTRSAATTAGPRGRWTVVATLPEGRSRALVTARDRAGNSTKRGLIHRVDTTAPKLTLTALADEALTTTDRPLLYGSAAADPAAALTYSVTVNGRPVHRAVGAATGETVLTTIGATASDETPVQADGRRFALAVGTLPQGRNRIVVSATDRAGNSARVATSVLVDTSEQLGTADLVAGARGADVAQLQELLRSAGVYPKKAAASAVFDRRTVAAVKRYQKRRSLPVTGTVDGAMHAAMVGRIVINLTQRKLRVVRDGRVVKTYRVAIGAPGHATPTGDFEVVNKQVDPTWFPPDSPWAAGLGPVPPGPGNPLGTRWIGTSAPAIGIHGTYADSSIGTAASHGCLRMHIPDVEELYEQVSLGMKVSIRA